MFKLQDMTKEIIKTKVRCTSPVSIDLMYAIEEITSHDHLKTAYLNKDELSQCLVKFNHSEQKLYLGSEVLDTENYTSKSGMGFAAYALDDSGRLYIAEHRSSRNTPSTSPTLPAFQKEESKLYFYHSSFFRAKPGKCFGLLKAEKGKITYIDNHSGHYKPQPDRLVDLEERLGYAFHPDCVVNPLDNITEEDDDNLANFFGPDF